VWIGTDDGLIQLTQDDGKTWTNVTPRAMTSWSRVTMIEASHFAEGTAYASVDRHQLQDFDPYIYRTRDMGKTWEKITKGLPAGVYVHVVREDPKRKGLLFAGTERGVVVSFDDGNNWQSLAFNIPVTSIRDIQVYQNDLIVATHGRGFWVIDDITPLRQINAAVLSSDVYLFKPADTMDMIPTDDNGTPLQKDEPHADNPPNGVAIDFYLRKAGDPVTLEILDSTGKVIKTFSTNPSQESPRRTRGGSSGGLPRVSPLWQTTPERFSGAAGMHRVVWEPLIPPPPRPAGATGGFGGDPGTRVSGTFTARLSANGKSQTQTFSLVPDPRSRPH
jgi:hypothetical protein